MSIGQCGHTCLSCVRALLFQPFTCVPGIKRRRVCLWLFGITRWNIYTLQDHCRPGHVSRLRVCNAAQSHQQAGLMLHQSSYSMWCVIYHPILAHGDEARGVREVFKQPVSEPYLTLNGQWSFALIVFFWPLTCIRGFLSRRCFTKCKCRRLSACLFFICPVNIK